MQTFPSLRGQGAIAIDCETCDPDLKTRGPGPHRGSYIAGVAVATEAGYADYYPVAHEGGGNLPKKKVFAWLKKELAHDVPKIGTKLLYDLEFLAAADVHPTGPFYDIQNAEPLLNENRFQYGLDVLAKDYLGTGKFDEEMTAHIVEHFGKKNPKNNIWRAPAHIVAPYAIMDVKLPLEIFKQQKLELKKQNLWELFEIESKLVPMLLAMRQRGVAVNLDKAEQLYKLFSKQQKELITKIKRLSGINIAPWNAGDIARVFDKLGLEYPRTPKTDAPSFRKEWLEQHDHPVTDMIRETRKLDKLRETFIKSFILEGHTNGRIHCQFNQLKSDGGGTVTGRFSSSTPNLQQIPARTAEGQMIRQIFIPDDGKWWKKDYSQIEYRLMVHDAAGLKLDGAADIVHRYKTEDDVDFHRAVAQMVWGPNVTKDQRDSAKTINFGIAYGEGLDKLCHSLGLSREDGEALLKKYHAGAPFMKPLAQIINGRAGREGEVETLLGRKRRFNTWQMTTWKNKEKKVVYKVGERPNGAWQRAFIHKGLNASIQGSAADVMKLAMVNIWESGVYKAVGVPQLTVHDELDGSTPDTPAAREALAEISNLMENCFELRVPLKVDSKIGANWGECK